MKTFHELQEGVYDPNIFKAIFLAGGPGSGKSYVVRRTTGGMGMKIVNSDDIYEKMLKDAGLDTKDKKFVGVQKVLPLV
jgi:cytidylate kinase